MVDTRAELEGDMRPGQLLVEECRGAALPHRRGQRFVPHCRKLAVQYPPANRAAQAPGRPVPHHEVHFVGVVAEAGADLATNDLLMPITTRGNVGPEALHHAGQA